MDECITKIANFKQRKGSKSGQGDKKKKQEAADPSGDITPTTLENAPWAAWCKELSQLLSQGITTSTLLICGCRHLVLGIRTMITTAATTYPTLRSNDLLVLQKLYSVTNDIMSNDLGRAHVEEALAHISMWMFDVVRIVSEHAQPPTTSSESHPGPSNPTKRPPASSGSKRAVK
jgi:hypothetical protein